MPSIIDLAPEIRNLLWMSLTGDKASLCAVRLVCHQLEEDASPHLFSSITLSTRPATLDLALQVAQSPRLRKYPRTLIFDTSTYAVQEDTEEMETQEVEIQYAFLGVLPRRNRDHNSLDRARRKMNRMAVMTSYKNAKAQESWVIAHMLQRAATKAMKLPRLKHLVITDYRSFAHTGKSPSALFRRVLGSTPLALRLCSEVGGAPATQAQALITILTLAGEHGAYFESFTCARNSFASDNAEADHRQNYLYTPACLPLQAVRILSEASAVSQLKYCRLVIEHDSIKKEHTDDEWVPGPLHRFLRQAGSHLAVLTLRFINYESEESGRFASYHVCGHFLSFFGQMVEGLRLSRIRTLELGSIPFYLSDFREFLSTHRTLRHVRLVNCVFNCQSLALRTMIGEDFDALHLDIVSTQ